MYHPSYHRTPEGAIHLTEDDTLDNNEIFEAILRNEIPGCATADRLMVWLETETDLFSAPCSTVYHLNFHGGLVLHSLKVFEIFDKLCDLFYPEFPAKSRAICALFHDLCKVNTYVPAIKSRKTGEYWPNGKAKWEDYAGWDFDEQFPYGHGEKSVYLLMKIIPLSDEEAMAIRWHMGGFDNFAKSDSRPLSNATQKYPVITLLQAADMIATSQGF